jgi:G3E family GTPase
LQVIMIGGFSSLCKIGIIQEILTKVSYANPSAKLTVVLNGESDFISSFEKSKSLDIDIEFFGEGCFCCGLKNELQSLLNNQMQERDPDIVLMTLSVVTDLDQVGHLMKDIIKDKMELLKIYGLDLDTSIDIIRAFPDMVDRNIIAAESVILFADGIRSAEAVNKSISLIRTIDPSLIFETQIEIQGKESTLISRNEIPKFGMSNIYNYFYNNM